VNNPADVVDVGAGERSSLARGAAVNLAGRILGQGIQLAVQVLLARVLGPAAFGIYSIGWLILRMGGALIAPLGLDDGVIRFASQVRDHSSEAFGALLRQGIRIAVLSGGAVGLLVFLTASLIADRVYKVQSLAPVLMAFAPAFPMLAGLRVSAAETRINQQMGYSIACEEIAAPILQIACVLAVYLLGGGLGGAAAATSFSLFVAFAVSLVFVMRLYPVVVGVGRSTSEHAPDLRRVLAFSLPTMVGGLALNLLMWLDQLLIGVYAPASAVGAYRCASISATLLSVVLSAFNMMVSSQIAGLHYDGHDERLASLLRTTARWSLYIGLPPFLVMFFAPEAILSIFGTGYESGAWALRALAIGHLAHLVGGPAAPAVILTGSPRPWTAMTFAALVANLVLNLLWVSSYGAVGAAAARAVALSGLVVATVILMKQKLGFWLWNEPFQRPLLAGAITFGILWLVSDRAPSSTLPRLVVIGTAAATSFFGLLVALGLDIDDRRIAWRILERLGVNGIA
jgi:O-antigen/teichoic acid export membrane protein